MKPLTIVVNESGQKYIVTDLIKTKSVDFSIMEEERSLEIHIRPCEIVDNKRCDVRAGTDSFGLDAYDFSQKYITTGKVFELGDVYLV